MESTSSMICFRFQTKGRWNSGSTMSPINTRCANCSIRSGVGFGSFAVTVGIVTVASPVEAGDSGSRLPQLRCPRAERVSRRDNEPDCRTASVNGPNPVADQLLQCRRLAQGADVRRVEERPLLCDRCLGPWEVPVHL